MEQLIKFHYRSLLTLGITLSLLGCNRMSEQITDESAGLNGGFEVTQQGLPVNWLMYTPNTVPQSDFEIVLDKEEFIEGKQSLRFDVKACSGIIGWRSPGFTNEFFTSGRYKGPARIKLSFWIKNQDASYEITAGGIEAKGGDMKTLLKGNEDVAEWKQFEYEFDVAKDRWLRLQLNILQPGTFWIDNIEIEKL